MQVTIKPAQQSDLEELYQLALATPELQVSVSHSFMERDELAAAIIYPQGVLLCARLGEKLVGFVYANVGDLEIPLAAHWACLVYLAVLPEYRKQGIANQLAEVCLAELKKRGITNVYGWARAGGEIVKFLEKRGFTKGHEYVWMDKTI